jgi:hypothetical protein
MTVTASILASASRARPRPLAALTLLALLPVLGSGLSACADMSEGLTTAFADPAKYELYNCAQLEPERKSLANRMAELQGLMARADGGFAGPVVGELAYRNDYIAVRGQAHFAEEAWRRNKCHETAPPAGAPGAKPATATLPAPSANTKPVPPSKSGSAVY